MFESEPEGYKIFTAYVKFKYVKGHVGVDIQVSDERERIVRIDDRRYFRDCDFQPARDIREMIIVPDAGDTLKYVYYYRDPDEISIFKDETWYDLPAWGACRYLALHNVEWVVHPELWQIDAETEFYPPDLQDVCDVIRFLRHYNLSEFEVKE